jgi:hypothetical protein
MEVQLDKMLVLFTKTPNQAGLTTHDDTACLDPFPTLSVPDDCALHVFLLMSIS